MPGAQVQRYARAALRRAGGAVARRQTLKPHVRRAGAAVLEDCAGEGNGTQGVLSRDGKP